MTVQTLGPLAAFNGTDDTVGSCPPLVFCWGDLPLYVKNQTARHQWLFSFYGSWNLPCHRVVIEQWIFSGSSWRHAPDYHLHVLMTAAAVIHHCLFIWQQVSTYFADGLHIWTSFPYPPPTEAVGSRQLSPNREHDHKSLYAAVC